jgi:dipeptidyl aminopeptidase/acylaminoacyl peptidase
VTWSSDGQTAYFMCNPKLPGTYEVCSTSTKDGALKELTALGGVESFTLSPDGRKLLVRYSTAYMPTQIGTVPATGGDHPADRHPHRRLQGARVDPA